MDGILIKTLVYQNIENKNKSIEEIRRSCYRNKAIDDVDILNILGKSEFSKISIEELRMHQGKYPQNHRGIMCNEEKVMHTLGNYDINSLSIEELRYFSYPQHIKQRPIPNYKPKTGTSTLRSFELLWT